MAVKKSVPCPAPAGRKKSAVPAAPDTETLALMAKMAASASLNGAAVMEPFQKNVVGGEVKAQHLFDELADQVKQVQAGDLRQIEAMLLAQAVALQSVFTSLARKAANQEYLPQFQAHMALGLKAQAQSRATLEALIEMKLPRQQATFVAQANIAHGPQQVNNAGSAAAPAQQVQTPPNKLLEVQHGEWLEQGTPTAAGRADPVLAALGEVHRPAVP